MTIDRPITTRTHLEYSEFGRILFEDVVIGTSIKCLVSNLHVATKFEIKYLKFIQLYWYFVYCVGRPVSRSLSSSQ